MPRRFETIVDAARERSVAPPPVPKSASLYATQAVLFSILWWSWLYAIGHILMYLIVVGGPQLGLGETNQEVGNYLASFDIGIAIVAAVTALAGCLFGWLPGSEPGILRRAETPSRRTAKQILRLVVVGKIITSLWAVVFVSPLEAYEGYRYLFIGALVAALFTLTGNSIARWFLVVVLLLDVVVFSFLGYALSNDANAMLTIVEMLALAGFLVASASMLTFLLLSSRVNRFYGT